MRFDRNTRQAGAGLVEGGCSAACTFTGMTAGIEPAIPSPRVFVMRDAGADRDLADAHVTVINVPAFLTGIGRAAAGEFGHATIKAHRGTAGNRPALSETEFNGIGGLLTYIGERPAFVQ